MGRWDVLNPDKSKQGSRNPTHQTTYLITDDHNHAAHPTRNTRNGHTRWRGQVGVPVDSRRITVWTLVLEEQLGCFQKNEPGFNVSRVESTLSEILQSSKEERLGLRLVAIVRILEIQDHRIQKLALGVISHRANDDLPQGDAVTSQRPICCDLPLR